MVQEILEGVMQKVLVFVSIILVELTKREIFIILLNFRLYLVLQKRVVVQFL